jgi:DNA repair photolyase
MHGEQDWVTQEDASNQAYKYYMRNDPTTREFMGPIEIEYDGYLKQEVRFRHAKVGTVRGAVKENMREVKVYLDPVPHLRVDSPKPLQGWYSNKNDGSLQNQRDRPCMTDAVLTQPYGGYCSVGCTSFCLLPGEMVDTPMGPRSVETLRAGDFVWGRTPLGLTLASIMATSNHLAFAGHIELALSDGRVLRLTSEHPVFSKRRGWIQAGELNYGEEMETIEEASKELCTLWKCFRGPKRPQFSNAFYLGSFVSALVGLERLRLGVRALYARIAKWARIHSRFSTSRWSFIGGEGTVFSKRFVENEPNPTSWLSHNPIVAEGSAAVGRVRVATITRVPGVVRVFDIQTTTENFYHNGALVHNCYVMSGQYGYRATGLTSVPLNYGEYVRKQLVAMQTGQAGYFSSFTDPFMKIEELYHNTQQGATAFVEAGLPVFFLSRLKYPGWAFDLLQRSKYSYMQKSINTPNQADWKLLSPGAASLVEHFDQIREARRKGIYVSIQCNPIIPGVVDHSDIEQLIELLAEARANHVIFKFVESNHAWRASMVERLTEKFGSNRMAIFAQLMVEKQGGNQTTIEEGYRREGHERYRAKCQSLGLTSSLCYEYTKRRVTEGDGPFGKTTTRWVSMGPEFLTSDQCHGHRVPFHVKHADGKFHPLGVCPPSGCLSCADEHEGTARCGSELLGSAKALVLADFKRDPGVDASALKIGRYRSK